jgi:hypothetical protein
MTTKANARKPKSPIIVQMMYDAIPGPNVPKEERVGGAYVIAFIREPTVAKAVVLELQTASENGWVVQSLQEACIRARSEMHDAESRASYDEACAHGTCRRFYCYPDESASTVAVKKKPRSKKVAGKSSRITRPGSSPRARAPR